MVRGDTIGKTGARPGTDCGRNDGQGRRVCREIGEGGNCVCPSCGNKVVYQPSVPCSSIQCLRYDTMMPRQQYTGKVYLK